MLDVGVCAVFSFAAQLRHLASQIGNSLAQRRVLGLHDSQPILRFTTTSYDVVVVVIAMSLVPVTSFLGAAVRRGRVVTTYGDVVDLGGVLVQGDVSELARRRPTTRTTEVVTTDRRHRLTAPSVRHICTHTRPLQIAQ